MGPRILWFGLYVCLLFAIWPDAVIAQGCAMCGTALSNEDPITAGFNWSIVFLMMMPYAIMLGIGGWVYNACRRKNN